MMPRPTTAAETGNPVVPVRFVIVTLDSHLAGAIDRAKPELERVIPGLQISLHAAAEWGHDETALERCRTDIEFG